jgi:hypothetical protein
MKTFILKTWLLCSLLTVSAPALVADSYTDRRVLAGVKVFQMLLAADLDIAEKAGGDGSLVLCLLYLNDKESADGSRQALSENTIRELPARIEILSLEELLQRADYKPAGIFLTEPLPQASLQSLIHYSAQRRVALYSPFEGDVEKGVMAGLAVEARVRPYLNMAAVQNAGIRIKPFFVKVAKLYE